MTRPDWPHTEVWISRDQRDISVEFTQTDGRICVPAIVSDEPRPLVWLGVVTRKVVQQITGLSSFAAASARLRSGDHKGLPDNPSTHPDWPQLPYQLLRRNDGDRVVILGGCRHDERRIKNAFTAPFPDDPDVVWDLDLLVEEAICLVTDHDDYQRAIHALGKLDRYQREGQDPRTRGMGDPFETTGGTWISDWKAAARPVPEWRGRDPNVVSGGLPGHGKRR